MGNTATLLSIALAVAVIVAVGVASASAQSTSGNPSFILSAVVDHAVAGSSDAGPSILTGGRRRGSHRAFRGFRGSFLRAYPSYSYYGVYNPEFSPSPSTTCVWDGWQYKCYKFLDDFRL